MLVSKKCNESVPGNGLIIFPRIKYVFIIIIFNFLYGHCLLFYQANTYLYIILLFTVNIFIAPSRNLDHQRPWEEEGYLDSSYRSSVGQSTGAIPSYNSKFLL